MISWLTVSTGGSRKNFAFDEVHVKSTPWSTLAPIYVLLLCLQPLRGDAQSVAPDSPQKQASREQPAAQAASQSQPARPQTAPQKSPVAGTSDREPKSPFSLMLYEWVPRGAPVLRGGAAANASTPGNLDLPGEPRLGGSQGFELSMPAGRGNSLRFSYFRTVGIGNTSAPENITLFNIPFNQGDYLVTRYRIQNGKISFDYLSYPFPTHGAKLRLKTLWEVQYTDIGSRVHAALKPVEDSSGNWVPTLAGGTRTIVYPTFGLGVDYLLSPRVRLEARASGFGVPHRAALWDSTGTAVIRIRPQIDVLVGAKGFHFKSSPKNAQVVKGTLAGVYVGLRWSSR